MNNTNYSIRLATMDDIDKIMDFLKKWWSPSHIMVLDREYFLFEFAPLGALNFVLAVDDKDEILGLLGFIHSSKGLEGTDNFGSIWRVRDDVDSSVGIELDVKMRELSKCRYRVGIGLNPKTAVPIVRLILREKCARMNHFYLLNNSISQYKIAKISQPFTTTPINNKDMEISLVKTRDFSKINEYFSFEDNGQIPYKDSWYYERHYFNNPWRDYTAYIVNVTSQNVPLEPSMIIARECFANDSKVLRIVDYVGPQENLSYCNKALTKLMIDNNYEYIDFYEFGFNTEYLSACGFLERTKDDANIIPNYFEPFEQRNVDIWVRYTEDSTTLFKGDGDQDRANLVK